MPSLRSVRDEELLRQLLQLVKQSRGVEADVVAHIGVVERRRLYAREACSSMFEYCRRVLHLRENEAYLRITVARAARENPDLLEMLRDGRLHLSGIARLAPHLTRENAQAVLKRAAGMSHREIRELVAELEPRPDVAAAIRRLPERRAPDTGSSPKLGVPELKVAERALPERGLPDRGVPERGVPERGVPERGVPEVGEPGFAVSGVAVSELGAPRVESHAVKLGAIEPGVTAGAVRLEAPVESRVAAPVRPAVVEPLAPARYQVRFTASAELRDKLERLQALMRSSVPDGDLARIIEIAVSEKLQRIEAKRFGQTKSPRSEHSEVDTRPTSRQVPAAVRRLVHARDGGRCAYRDRHGRRCDKRHDLEFHHRHPFAHGGDHSPSNVTLLCRSHNNLLAEQDYGEDFMARFRALETSPASVSANLCGAQIVVQPRRLSSA